MNRAALVFIACMLFHLKSLHSQTIELDSDYCDWYFSIGKSKKQFLAIVPGSNINDLVCNKLIDPLYVDDNVKKVSWIEDSIFTYITTFDFTKRAEFNYTILCEGLDTYADVYLNNQLVLKGNNMFVAYEADISGLLRDGTNLIKIVFRSAQEIGKQKAKINSIKFPADNEEGEIKVSPFVRKAAFQFGWDINPRLLSCGIWKPIKIITTEKNKEISPANDKTVSLIKPFYKLKMKEDETGESFAFYTNEKKTLQTFIYGANYVPYNMYPLPIKNYKRAAHIQKNQGLPNRHDYYRNIFKELKAYGCNMLRVWGGGWYEDDYFYELADSMHIAIWQDFMFANTMYPGNEDWINSVKEEVEQQITRIGKHPCVVAWSGNNEIEVAWKNWGWQQKYGYNYSDSLKLVKDYDILFKSIIPKELEHQNSGVSYISSSPISNWGRSEDFKKGDNHYWGIWHGEAPLEDFYTHVPRFASEYGMPSLGVNESIQKYNTVENTVQIRMKSYKGIKLLNQYINKYLPTPTSDIALSYSSRYIQYKSLKMAYNAHSYNYPYCSGSLLWQFNESWPGITWSVIDFDGNRKVPPYTSPVSIIWDNAGTIKMKIRDFKNTFGFIDYVEFNIKNIDGETLRGEKVEISKKRKSDDDIAFNFMEKLNVKNGAPLYLSIHFYKGNKDAEQLVFDTLITLQNEKEYITRKPDIKTSLIDSNHLKISSNELVLGLFLECRKQNVKFNQNFINIEPGKEKIISFESSGGAIDLSEIKFYSLYDLQKETK